MADEKKEPKTIEEAIAYLEQMLGKNIIVQQSTPPERVPVISTGSLALDTTLGVGGVPRGRVTEIYGLEGSGKSSLAYMLCAEAQHAGGKALYVDMEHEVELSYVEACGVDIKALYFSQPDSGTDAWQIVKTMIGLVDLIIVDSVASLVTPAELDSAPADQHVGLLARLMSNNLKRVKPKLGGSNTALVFVNQIREKVGVGPHQNPEVAPGGRALKFYANIRLELRRADFIGRPGEPIGHQVKVRVVKNKLAPPFRTCFFDIIYGKGPRRETETLDFAAKLGIVEKKGTSHYYYKGEKLANGREAAAQVLTEKPELFNELRQAVTEALAKGVSLTEPVSADDGLLEEEL